MPYISELYCNLCDNESPTPFETPISVICPLSGAVCDGGGNRHQTAIRLNDKPNIQILFEGSPAKVIPNARKGRYISGHANADTIINNAPNLLNPIIIEIMTASTSGSDTQKGTNII